MPYLQLDMNAHYSGADMQLLAARTSETHAKMMSFDVRRISIPIRELDKAVASLSSGAIYVPSYVTEPADLDRL